MQIDPRYDYVSCFCLCCMSVRLFVTNRVYSITCHKDTSSYGLCFYMQHIVPLFDLLFCEDHFCGFLVSVES